MDSRKSKSRNWSVVEISILVDFVVNQYAHLASRSFWEETAVMVNTEGYNNRSAHDCKRKWVDLKSLTKRKALAHKKESVKTGGGPPPVPLTEMDNKIMGVIPTVSVEGVVTNGDTFKEMDVNHNILKECSNTHLDDDKPCTSEYSTTKENIISKPLKRRKKERRHDYCSCQAELLDIQRGLLEESKKRNEILKSINNNIILMNQPQPTATLHPHLLNLPDPSDSMPDLDFLSTGCPFYADT